MKDDGKKIDGEALLRSVPGEWLTPTLEIARTMSAQGERVWIVGGGVRDLILGRPIKDIDLVSAALPDKVESLFPRTVPVGKAFGIVVVVLGGKEIEVATFRQERGYSDSRRPDQIVYAESPEVDARRRDFTCNALYLDPLNGEIVDPAGGLSDLAAKELRAVGDAAARFREDGLRLLRAGRFLAALDLQPAPGLLGAMAAEVDSIRGVSPERVLDETSKILRGPDPARAVGILAGAGVFAGCMPGWQDADDPVDGAACAEVLDGCLPSQPRGQCSPVALGLAVLLDPGGAGDMDSALNRLDQLKASRELRSSVMALLRMRSELLDRVEQPVPAEALERGSWIALARDPFFEAGATLAVAGQPNAQPGGLPDGKASDSAIDSAVDSSVDSAFDRGELIATLDALRALSDGAPSEPVELTPKDAMAAGLQPGPSLGEVLRRAKLMALAGEFDDRAGALAWLEREVRDLL
jgi:tRNA nucleotidyltransferase/poly(A) polymerase